MKQMKVLSVLALTLALGLTACGGGGGKSSTHRHKYGNWGDDPEHTATCTVAGKEIRTCSECGHVDTRDKAALGHEGQPASDDAEGWIAADYVAPGCETPGNHSYMCTRCNQKVDVPIDATGHEAAPAADAEGVWTPISDPTCTEPGSHSYLCSKCQQQVPVEIAALGHNFDTNGDGTEDDDDVNWAVRPTCEEGGTGVKACTRCSYTEDVTAEALGHDWSIGENPTVTPAQGPGYANFYEFPCAHGCGKTSLGFRANEPTEESKERLVFEENSSTHEVGARFWGRPIGNALALDSSGTSVNQQNYECVYSTAETGDFFEYKFDLTAAQAETLSTCRCYVDAKPANYLNGADFWACSSSADEWTPGYYIDGSDEHVEKNDDGTDVMVEDHAAGVRARDGERYSQAECDAYNTENNLTETDEGYRTTSNCWKVEPVEAAAGAGLGTQVKQGKRISNYRYILYVDDEVQEFDPSITAPTSGNNTNMRRAEFVMPFTFHLHAGTNTISLRMAGGYRSLFYNFYFRQYVAPTPAEGGQQAA